MTIRRTVGLSALLLTGLLAANLCTAGACLAQEPAAAAAVKLPDTPAGKKAGMFLEAINSGDAERLSAFMKAHYPSQAGNPQGRMIQEQALGLDLVGLDADRSSENELVARLKTRKSGTPVTMRVLVEPAPPHGVLSIGLLFQ